MMKFFLIITFVLLTNIQAEFMRDDTLEVVHDKTTCLMWQDDINSKIVDTTWQRANDYCQTLDFAGYDNWRLPNQNELYSISDKSRYNPAIKSVFKNVVSSMYWSSTTVKSNIDNAWGIYFSYSKDEWSDKDSWHHVRCVRAQQ